MQTVTVEINDVSAFKELANLEKRQILRIIDNSEYDSPSLPGKPLSLSQFKEWIQQAEETPTVTLAEAETKWKINR